jgi:uncharacterized protein involved in exopolysaccharide biosynthesis
MENEQAYRDEIRAQMEQLQADLNHLEAKIREKGADEKLRWQNEIEDLKSKHQSATRKIAEMGEKSGEAFDEIRQGIDKAMIDLADSINDARHRLSD